MPYLSGIRAIPLSKTSHKMKTPTVPTQYNTTATDAESGVALSDIYLAGYSRGWNCASWQDIPEIGSTVRTDAEGEVEIEGENDQADIMSSLAFEAELNDRNFSPFEFTAKELNDLEDSEDAWEAFEAGISDGINANISSRFPSA